MGTGDPGKLKVAFGLAVAGFTRVLRGDFYRSDLINYLMLDSNDHFFFEKECTSWLSFIKIRKKSRYALTVN